MTTKSSNFIRSNTFKGILLVMLSLFMYALSDALIKKTLIGGYSVEQATFLRALTRTIPLVIAMLIMHRSFQPLKTERPWVHLINSVIGCGRTYAFMVGYNKITLAEASALSYTSAIFFVILSVIFLKEKIQKFHIWAILFGIIGVLIAYQPGAEIFKLGAIIILVGAFFAAVNKIIIRKLSFHDNSFAIVIYSNIFLMLVTLPFLPGSWKEVPMNDMFVFIIIGSLAALAQYSFAIALRLTTGLTLAPYDYTFFVWIIIMSYIFNGEVPTLEVILGALFIIGSNVIILSSEFRKVKSGKEKSNNNQAATAESA